MAYSSTATPITIVTGFLGSGKTTLLLSLLPQLPKTPPYRLALLKNEFGDVAIDSQLASASAISGVTELLNGCICCNLVGQLSDALKALRALTPTPDRIVIETSGSAFPATLAMEVNRVGRESGSVVLDGVVVVVDVENWRGYDDTSYTARMQMRYTDLVVFNKWESVGEDRLDECRDRLGDMDIDVPWVRSDRGSVPLDLVFGVDGALAKRLEVSAEDGTYGPDHGRDHDHDHAAGHQSEVEVLSVALRRSAGSTNAAVNVPALEAFLRAAPRDEIYRIKAVLTAAIVPASSDAQTPKPEELGVPQRYILNWAFGRWTFTPMPREQLQNGGLLTPPDEGDMEVVVRMTVVLARDEAAKWKRKIEGEKFMQLEGGENGALKVERLL